MKRNPLNTRRKMKMKKKKKLKREELDSDMHLEIVSRLPFKEAVQCRLVCKSWHTLLDDNFLINIHAKTQLKLHGYDHQHAHSSSSSIVSFISFSPDKPSFFELFDDNLCSYKESSFKVSASSKLLRGATMINSCNGLICSYMNDSHSYSRSIAIYNPVTTELLRLRDGDFADNTINGCLGYNPSTKEYKILRTNEHGSFSFHQIYTIGSTGRWKNIKCPPFNYYDQSVHVNGVFYWIIRNHKNGGSHMEREMIMSFDLADEEFRILTTLPPPLMNNMKPKPPLYKLVESRGCLLLFVDQYSSRDYPHLELWVMKEKEKENENDNDNGCRYYWSNLMEISTHGHRKEDYEFIALTQSGKVLFWHDGIVLTCFDPKTEKFASISDMPSGRYHCVFDIVPHTNSLVSFIALEAAIPKKKKMIRRNISYFCCFRSFYSKEEEEDPPLYIILLPLYIITGTRTSYLLEIYTPYLFCV